MKTNPAYKIRVFTLAAIVFAATLLFTFVVGLVALHFSSRVETERAVEQHLEETVASVDDAETSMHSYFLTANGRYLQAYRQALTQIEMEKDILRGHAAAGELAPNGVENLIRDVEAKQSEMREVLLLHAKSGLSSALASLQTGRGIQLTDAIHGDIEKQKSAVTAVLAKTMRRAQLADSARVLAFVFTIVTNLAFLAWADVRVTRTARAREAAILEMKRQKELLGTTLASIGDGVIVTDTEENVTFLNAEAARLTGWNPKEAAGQPVSKVFRIVDATTRQTKDSPVKRALRFGAPTGQINHTLLLSKTGAEYPIDESAAPIRQQGGAPFGVVVVFRDWTNQNKAEETRSRLAAIVESSEDAIISKGLDGIVRTWNIGAEKLFGYKPEEMIGKPITLLLPPERLGEEDFILGKIRRGLRVERIETVRVAKDGARIPVSLSVSPLRDEHGHIIGASKIVHDATEIVAARENLARGREELELRVQERTTKLQEMVNELQHISYSITHDMRAPLRAMSAFAEMLMDQTSESRPTPLEAEDYCRRIVRAARRLDQLIVDALSYTKVVLQEVPQSPVDLDKIVRDLIDVYPHLHPSRADIQVEGTLPMVTGNESYLTQCFSNLLGNAVKFVTPGIRPVIRVRAENRGDVTRIWVEDNGIGIPAAAQKRLFGMYEKLDDRYEGTGIGLAIVRKVVERMGGTVGAISEQGHGSRFWVELHLVPDLHDGDDEHDLLAASH